MFVKAIIIIFMLTILYSLGSSFYFMLKDKGEGDRALKRLMWRIGLSIFLLLLLYIMFLLGWIEDSFLKIIVSRILIRSDPKGGPEKFYGEFFSSKTLIAFK